MCDLLVVDARRSRIKQAWHNTSLSGDEQNQDIFYAYRLTGKVKPEKKKLMFADLVMITECFREPIIFS